MSKYFDGKKLSGYEESPITYVYGGNLEECHKQISDLEAKLAESESNRKSLEEKVKFLTEEKEENFVDGQKYNELKQQLAEKTLTIEQINKAFIENRSLWKGKYEQAHQDKIDFAIEQLEKVKEFVNEIYGEYSASITTNFIDNQINELKGESKWD